MVVDGSDSSEAEDLDLTETYEDEDQFFSPSGAHSSTAGIIGRSGTNGTERWLSMWIFLKLLLTLLLFLKLFYETVFAIL